MSDAVMPMRSVPCADAALDVSVAKPVAKQVKAAAHLIDVIKVTSRIEGIMLRSPAARSKQTGAGGVIVRRHAVPHLFEPDGGEILEPVLRLHEALDLW
jgi:hypothetical protein